MQTLDQAVQVLIAGGARNARGAAVAELEGLIEACQTAAQVWQGYLDSPGAPGDRWSILSWIGPQRVRRLHEINLSAKERVRRLSAVCGPSVSRFAMLDEDVIEMAYRNLREGETGSQAATQAMSRIRASRRCPGPKLRAGQPAGRGDAGR